jgi:hypothetical protein
MKDFNFNPEEWLAANNDYKDYMDYLMGLVADMFDLVLFELEVKPCRGAIHVKWRDSIGEETTTEKQTFTREGIEAGVIESVVKMRNFPDCKGAVFVELGKRGLNICRDGNGWQCVNSAGDIFKQADTFQKAYQWALQQPCRNDVTTF